MALSVYNNSTFVPGNQVVQPSTYSGDGSSDTFPLQNDISSVNVADTIQVDLDYYLRALNGFSFPTTTTMQISEVPPDGSQILVPGKNAVVFSAFDQVTVSGVDSPANVDEVAFWVADDGTGLTTTIYDSMPGTPGIGILFTNLVTAAGAQTSWLQLACADASGSALTYQATGTTLYTGKYSGFTAMASACNALATTILTTTASSPDFVVGDYIRINPGGGTQEDVQITAKSTNTLTISGTNFAHSTGEFIFMVGRKFWAKLTFPPDILAGAPASFYNCPLTVQATLDSRT